MFRVGDYVAHYKEGVCEVVDVGKLEMSCSDREKEYYTLKPLYDAGGTYMTTIWYLAVSGAVSLGITLMLRKI